MCDVLLLQDDLSDDGGSPSRSSPPVTSQPSPKKQNAPVYAMPPPPSYNASAGESAALNQGDKPVYTPGS